MDEREVNTSADEPTSENWSRFCKNGHDKLTSGWTQLNGCRECKREAARRYREARKAGKPLQENKRQRRTDLDGGK